MEASLVKGEQVEVRAPRQLVRSPRTNHRLGIIITGLASDLRG